MTRRCPECLKTVDASRTFCAPAHKAAYHNRQTVRGRTLTPLQMAARITRGGSRGDVKTGRLARSLADASIQKWIEEDRAEGRMSAVEYIAQRTALGI